VSEKALADSFEDHCWRDIVSPETLEIYAPYRRAVGIRGSTALLAIDLFAGVFPDGPVSMAEAVRRNPKSCGTYAWNAIPQIQRLLGMARATNWPVIFTTSMVISDPGAAADARNRPTLRSVTGKSSSGLTNDYRIDLRFPVAAEDRVVLKSRASAFFGTDLAATLAELAIETLLVCGESTSGCVRATVVDAYSLGLHVAVVEECVFDRHLLSHKVNLFDMHHKYADVLHLSEVAHVAK